ncbi:cytochrome c oxidase assembly protein [Mobilicoccus caccae]|uniref:Copper resistance protein D n=1 Tax=Mobilicoccus caccae TaxID=1859295 RepID=A0ABQ6ITB3_9MICO|nr:cytochrome c oxidase assembly protein [Mobilicoccus caccae]GMA41184.1 copper resistance protein D [Mobilicoccus caccae]
MAISERTRSSRHASPRVAVTGLAGVIALVALIVAGQVGGVFEGAAGFADGGALARWGVPVARTTLDVSASITIGLLLLAGTIVPERNSTDRRRTACRIATVTGSVWVLASLALTILSISNLSGVHVTDPMFGAQVSSVIWEFEYFRTLFISTLIALAATLLAAGARTPTSITWAAALGVVAMLVLALIGHSAGAAAHDTAVNSIAVHMAAAAVWMGGLAALVILRPTLGQDLPVVAHRYSHLAIWAYGGIAVSGVVNASLRISGDSGLATPYGMLVVVKVVAFVLLGLAGWRMRSSLLQRLTGDDRDGRIFARLAALEITLMALAMGVAVALSRSAPPVPQRESPDIVTSLTGYPDPGPPSTLDWLTMFRIDWIFFAASVLAVGLYVAGVVRLHRRGDVWPWHRTVLWILGWALFVWTTSGAPGIYGRLTFSGHMLMHMTLTMGVPPLLAFGAPLTLASRALAARRDKTMGPREIMLATAHSRWMSFWANPVVAGANFAGSLYLFYFSDLFELALRTHVGHMAMIVHFMLAGYVFSWALIGIDPGPKRWAPSLRLVLLFATMSFHAFFGVAIISMTTLLAEDYFTQLALPWVGDLLADQQTGGGITWGIGEIPMLFLALLVALTWMRSDESEAKRRDRQAARDDDAELEAYNEAMRARGEAMRRADEAEDARYRARHPGHGR